MSVQHSHKTTSFVKKEFPIVLLCDGVSGPANIGSLFRIAEAFGIPEIIFGNANIDLSSNRMKRTARETYLKVAATVSEDLLQTAEHFREAGYLFVALEVTENSVPIQDFELSQNSNVVLMVGSEQNGISDEMLSLADASIHIELFGENSSINVAQATAIALYKLTVAK